MPAPVICVMTLPFFDEYNNWNWFPAKTSTDGTNLAGEILAREATAPTDVWIFFNLRQTPTNPAGGSFALALMTTFPYIYRPQETPAGVTFYNGCAIFSKYPLSQTAAVMSPGGSWNSSPGVQNLCTLGIFAKVTQGGNTYAVAGMDTLSCLHPSNLDYNLNNPTTYRYALTSPAINMIRGNLSTGWYHTFLAVNPGTYRTASGWTAWFLKAINKGPISGGVVTQVPVGSPYYFVDQYNAALSPTQTNRNPNPLAPADFCDCFMLVSTLNPLGSSKSVIDNDAAYAPYIATGLRYPLRSMP